jgi:GNAT superfamily N-acetyltransferase
MKNLELKFAERSDVALILSMIRELAEAEGLGNEVVATEQILADSLFGSDAIAKVVLAYHSDEPVGYAIFCPKFATYTGRNELYLQDMYVRPNLQRQGIGTALMARVAKITLDQEATRMEWFVLDTNRQALNFYDKLGAKVLNPIKVSRLEGERLRNLAERDR